MNEQHIQYHIREIRTDIIETCFICARSSEHEDFKFDEDRNFIILFKKTLCKYCAHEIADHLSFLITEVE